MPQSAGGPADRTAGVRADSAQDHARGNRGTRPAGRPGGEMIRVPGIGGGRLRQVERGASVGELVRRQLAHQHRSGRSQPCRAGGVLAGDVVLQDGGLAGGGDARGVDDVLQPDRDPVQRPDRTVAHDRGLGGAGFGHRTLPRYQNEGVQSAVQRVDPVEASLGQLHRRQFLRGNQPGRLGDGWNGHARSSGWKP